LTKHFKLRAAKDERFSDKEAIVNSDCTTEVKLQALLDHADSRPFKAQQDVITNLSEDECHVFSILFQLISPAKTEQESSEAYRSPSDEYSGSIYDIVYILSIFLVTMYFLLTRSLRY
jgi:hypothetical protein